MGYFRETSAGMTISPISTYDDVEQKIKSETLLFEQHSYPPPHTQESKKKFKMQLKYLRIFT